MQPIHITGMSLLELFVEILSSEMLYIRIPSLLNL